MRNSSSRVSRLLPPLREDARSVARFPALNARYPLTPLLRFTSRAMVLGARARRRAIAESVSLCARLRLTSSRSADVSRRYCFIVCIRIYCTHIRCVKCLTPSNKELGNGIYPWIVGNIQDANRIVNDGAYYIQVCQSGTSICDKSDSYFKITTSQTQPSITVLSPNGGEQWQLNSSHVILWTPYDAQT